MTERESSTAESSEALEVSDGADEASVSGPGGTSDFGEPGPRFERGSPFYFGFMAAAGALVAFFLFQALVGIASILLLIVVSLFLAAGLNPAVEFLERRRLGRAAAVSTVIVVVLLVLVLFVIAIVPVIADQVRSITAAAPGWLDELQSNESVQAFDEQYEIIERVRDYVADGDFLSQLFGGVVGFGLKVLGAFFNAFIVVVLTLYFLTSINTTKQALYNLAPASRRNRVAAISDQVIVSIGGYVSGAFIVGLCAGITSLVFLFFAGLSEYAVALAFVVALLDVIPMIGATIGAVIVSAIGFAEDLKIGIACVVFYLIYQQIENYVIYPRVMSRSVDVPGAVIVIAALVGAGLLGVVGALLAIPTAAAVLLIAREVVVRRQDVS